MYHPRAPLSNPTWFFGRRHELAQIFSYLDKPQPQNVSVVGQRRIGKSWLLKKIVLDTELRATNLTEPERYTFIYWDLQQERHLGPQMFIPRLTELVLEHIPEDLAQLCRLAVDDDDATESLLEILEVLGSENQRVVLLIDEFAAVTRSTAFELDFFSHLRSVFSQPALTCVTASFRSLGEMCHLGPDSPFFNIFSRVQLGLFTDEEAEVFILEPFNKKSIQIHPKVVEAMLKLTGPQPCFISALCHNLIHDGQVLSRGAIQKSDLEQHKDRLFTALSDDYRYYWRQLSDEERAMLHSIAAGDQPSGRMNPTLHTLKELGLVRIHNGNNVPFSQLFGDFLETAEVGEWYLQQAFSDPTYQAPSFIYLCQVALEAATNIPGGLQRNLKHAVSTIQGRPQDAMRICGRDILDPLLEHVYRREMGHVWNGDQFAACEQFNARAETRQFPKFLASSFHNIRIAGNDGSHQARYSEPCTPGRAFLTVLETIHAAEEVYRRYPA